MRRNSDEGRHRGPVSDAGHEPMKDAHVVPYLRERLPAFSPTGEPRRVPGGNLNVVWRVPGAERSLIVKYAPPYIAADPDTPLDPSRLLIEARCLRALGQGERLNDLTGAAVRPPKAIDLNPDVPMVVMEDIGPVPSFGRWLREADAKALEKRAAAQGRRLGAFLGRLHAATCDDDRCADAFNNRPMQETRHAVQYQGVADMLRKAGVGDADVLGRRAETLGRSLLGPGRCLTMGDLWPPSVLIASSTRLRIIDWELAHYGRPLQDVAHWCAHLWMQRQRAPSEAVARAVAAHRDAFLEAYGEALGDTKDSLWDQAERRDAAIHVGAELLVRAVGPFQAGYVYAGLDVEHSAVRTAVATAAEHLRAPAAADVLGR
ncbi:phosphotransferase family protein [Salinibacter ruber]|uniref:phosphotransferase family protein n=1 Tax=Salinibacter ruber TaxID=146919 RepID=UPI002169AC89|nr:aminoglycoside phosphotransferase family protein [Salinibacter ruber]MCS4041454.1 5-methylthioribose kinase [Salinibacter ruber]